MIPVVLLLAASSVANMAAQQVQPAKGFVPSEELNKRLPKWLRFSAEYRARLEGFTGGGFKRNSDDLYLLNRFRINMKIQTSSWLKFNFQGQDARVFWKNQRPAGPPFKDTMDLRMAYVEVGDLENKALGLRVGRQELAFGEQRLVGHVSWLNTARTFDAARAAFRYHGYRLDAFASTVVNIRTGAFNESSPGDNFHGVYGGIEKLIPRAVIEPYLFWRLAPNQPTEKGTRDSLDFKTVGFRWVGKIPGNFDYDTEMARQSGSLGTDTIRAWAGHWLVGYTFIEARYKPRLILEYNYASGDEDPRDGKRATFDQLYPTAHDKYGLADQVGWRNIHDLRYGVEFKPQAKWLVTSSYHSWWLASARDALYSAGGVPIARVADGSAGRRVGQELDFQAFYTLSKQIQIGSGFSHIFPGAFLKKATPGKSFNFPYVMFTYAF